MRRNARPVKLQVLVNVYDLLEANKYGYDLGIGAFHSGVELWGSEYSFGHHEYDSTGVFESVPQQCANAVFREQIQMGEIEITRAQVEDILDRLRDKYRGNTYHPLQRNCNHFSDELCQALLAKPLPAFVNRLAGWGAFFQCLLPAGILPDTPSADAGAEGGTDSFIPFAGNAFTLTDGQNGDDDAHAAAGDSRMRNTTIIKDEGPAARRERLAKAAMARMEAQLQQQQS